MNVTPVKTTADFKVLDESYQSPTIFISLELTIRIKTHKKAGEFIGQGN